MVISLLMRSNNDHVTSICRSAIQTPQKKIATGNKTPPDSSLSALLSQVKSRPVAVITSKELNTPVKKNSSVSCLVGTWGLLIASGTRGGRILEPAAW